jgi:hypothetical protein
VAVVVTPTVTAPVSSREISAVTNAPFTEAMGTSKRDLCTLAQRSGAVIEMAPEGPRDIDWESTPKTPSGTTSGRATPGYRIPR